MNVIFENGPLVGVNLMIEHTQPLRRHLPQWKPRDHLSAKDILEKGGGRKEGRTGGGERRREGESSNEKREKRKWYANALVAARFDRLSR